MSDDAFLKALSAHDDAVAALGLDIWLGAEPTFTDRASEAPEWLFAGLGDAKRSRAERMLVELAQAAPGCAVLRCVGKHYPGEDTPRWNLGYFRRRDGRAVWTGPPDPLLSEARDASAMQSAATFTHQAQAALLEAGFKTASFTIDDELPQRLVFRDDGGEPPIDPGEWPDLLRVPLETVPGEEFAAGDRLAATGVCLVASGVHEGVLRVELPGVATVELFLRLIGLLGNAARRAGVASMALTGFLPPVDATVAWESLSPDPAVIEVNVAPTSNAVDLFGKLARLHEIAASAELSPYRLQYNGVESDSGGGGQITLGGRAPTASPFLTVPRLLPNMIRYFNRHPALSYLFAPASVGPASQAPRPDEGQRDSMAELALTLEHLGRLGEPSPETLWAALAPFMTDPTGNVHRAEINIEKLWNPYTGARGKMGVVEFRALRMGRTPEMGVAVAVLFRAVVAMLATRRCDIELTDWGDELHGRFALPFMLHKDLDEVLRDLEHAGLGLDLPITSWLLDDADILIGAHQLPGCSVEVRRAIEFWPLVGDVAMQQGSSRSIDASTTRIELRLRPHGGARDLDAWTVGAAGWRVPMRAERDSAGAVRVIGLRYRAYRPAHGLHPTLASRDPLEVHLVHPEAGQWRLSLYDWQPEARSYPGLPEDISDARARRQDRLRLEPLAAPRDIAEAPPSAVSDFALDLRWR